MCCTKQPRQIYQNDIDPGQFMLVTQHNSKLIAWRSQYFSKDLDSCFVSHTLPFDLLGKCTTQISVYHYQTTGQFGELLQGIDSQHTYTDKSADKTAPAQYSSCNTGVNLMHLFLQVDWWIDRWMVQSYWNSTLQKFRLHKTAWGKPASMGI